MTPQENVVQLDSNLLAENARLELELEITLSLQQKTKQASIWMFNALCDTDALLDREKSKDLIERLEMMTVDSDSLRDDVHAVVKDLRDKRRKLTKKLKSKVFSPEAKAEKSNVEAIVTKQTKEIADKFMATAKDIKKPELTVVKSENANKSKANK